MPREQNGALITAVVGGSPADRAGLHVGECVTAVNGLPLTDLIDYLSLTAESDPRLRVTGEHGSREVAVIKGEETSLGLSFARAVFDGIRSCGNNCLFCFVDQLPMGARSSLRLKDEDYRLSFLQGNYVTLSHLLQADRLRIVKQRLSPLYVSVHTTDPALRGRMLGLSEPAPILPLLRELTAAGIVFQTQAVICPGWNGGPALERTISDLAALWPGVRSLAVVPVGLTAHRDGLAPLKPFDANTAAELLKHVKNRQRGFLDALGTRFVFAADEFYILSGAAVPGAGYYEDYPQLENGIGLIRSFEDDFHRAWRRWRRKIRPGGIRVVTGTAAAGMWSRLSLLLQKDDVNLEILPVTNRYFGSTITVAGLLAGQDIISALADRPRHPTFIPRVVLQRGGDILLDGMTEDQLARETGVEVIDTDAEAFLAGAARVLGDV